MKNFRLLSQIIHGSWSLAKLWQNIIGCEWVFWIKCNPNGRITWYKGRLVPKRFHQRLGLDYQEIFSLVIKPTTIQAVLSIALSLSRGWQVHQLDANNAFLHGHPHEEVFMSQPLVFMHQSWPHHVYHLCKSIRPLLYP